MVVSRRCILLAMLGSERFIHIQSMRWRKRSLVFVAPNLRPLHLAGPYLVTELPLGVLAAKDLQVKCFPNLLACVSAMREELRLV
jgi:hypothetical protein